VWERINKLKEQIQKNANALRTSIKLGAGFKWETFSLKQLQLLTWWQKGSPHANKNGIIAEGAIRTGKSICMSLSFVMWAMATFNYEQFAICGKTIGSVRRNVIFWLKIILKLRGYKVTDNRTDNKLEVSKNGRVNYFFLFGGRDERSYTLIQGITLAGILMDEVTLMPESFVNQAMSRLSVTGSKWWFNCNPAGPMHFFKIEFVDKADQKGIFKLHFVLDDNLSLSEEIKRRYRSQFTGVFYKRYILGLWVMAEGVIYDMFQDETMTYDDDSEDGPNFNLWYERHIFMDYGTTNPCVFLEIIRQDGNSWVHNEYYYDSKDSGNARQKDNEEYAQDLIKFVDGKRVTSYGLDPSAVSFRITLQKKNIFTRSANNEVLEGIRLVSTAFSLGKLKVHKRCKNLRKELQSYMWDEKAAQRGIEQPVKMWDHACDGLRYYYNTIIRRI